MQKTPKNLLARFHAMFTTHILLGIIGALLGTVALRVMGCRSPIFRCPRKNPGAGGPGLSCFSLLSGGEVAGAVSPMRSLATRSLNAIPMIGYISLMLSWRRQMALGRVFIDCVRQFA